MKTNIGYLIKQVNDKLKSKADADLQQHNLTLAHSRVLAFLSRNGGVSTQKEIELFLERSHPTIVGIISRMERNGYITCTLDEKDRRNKVVTLTPKAIEVRNEIMGRIETHEQQMLSSFSPEEREKLKEMLESICRNLA